MAKKSSGAAPPPAPPLTDFPAALRRLLTERGWSQSELARRLGERQATVNRWATGDREPGWEAMARIADALGVSLDRLRR